MKRYLHWNLNAEQGGLKGEGVTVKGALCA